MAKIILELPEEYDVLSITIIGQTNGGISVSDHAFDLEKGKNIAYSTKTGWVQTKERSNHEKSI